MRKLKEKRTERIQIRITPSLKKFAGKYKGEISEQINQFLTELKKEWEAE
jgi:hypothetical protein